MHDYTINTISMFSWYRSSGMVYVGLSEGMKLTLRHISSHKHNTTGYTMHNERFLKSMVCQRTWFHENICCEVILLISALVITHSFLPPFLSNFRPHIVSLSISLHERLLSSYPNDRHLLRNLVLDWGLSLTSQPEQTMRGDVPCSNSIMERIAPEELFAPTSFFEECGSLWRNSARYTLS